VSDTIRSGRNEIEVQHILQTAVSNRLVYGGGYRRDQVDVASTDANTNNPPPYAAAASFSFTEYRLFANDEWRYSQKLLVNAGGMLEKDAMGNHTFSPRISLNYHINPEHTLRFGSSIAHRTPSLGETNANQADLYQIGYLYEPAARPTSIGLEPEKILSREIGYLAELREWNTSIDLRLFSDQMSDLMYQLPNVGLWSNGVVANYRGEEATIKHAFSERSDLTFNCSTMVVNDNSVLLSAGQTNSVASSLPRTIANFLYSQRMADDISFSAAWYFQTSMVGLDRGPTDFQPTHRRVDVRLSRNFRGSNGMNSEVSAVVQNLFQTDYTEYIATALNNRRAFATLTLHWQ
jgi:iron complex outermembrane receptor protein